MTAKTDFQRWIELGENKPWNIGDNHDFMKLSIKAMPKIKALVDACRYLQEHCFEYGFEKFEQALKELTGE